MVTPRAVRATLPLSLRFVVVEPHARAVLEIKDLLLVGGGDVMMRFTLPRARTKSGESNACSTVPTSILPSLVRYAS